MRSAPARRHTIRTARDAADLFAPFLSSGDGGPYFAAHLQGDALIELVAAAPGHPNAPLPVRAILSDALRLGTTALIVAQDRRSGDPMPGEADVRATRSLACAAAGLGINLHDHLIFAGGEVRSFRALGLL